MRPRPPVAAPAPWQQPVPIRGRLDNGIDVLSLDLPGQQVVSVRTVLPATLTTEAPAHEGVTVAMARLLDEGAGDRDAETFALALERHGAAFGAGAVEGAVSVDLDVPVRHLGGALELLTDTLAAPRFPDEEVRRVLRNRVAEYDYETSSAPHRAGRELIATLWAPQSRAARPAAGTPETVGALDRQLIAARHRTLGPTGASVVIVGDLSSVDEVDLLQATLGSWRSPAQPPAAVPPLPAAAKPRIVLVDRPGAVQSEIAIGSPAVGRAAPDWPAYPLLAYLLGGSPGARIDAVLREEKGYTYGIRASMRPRAVGGSFVVAGSVRREVTGESLRLLLDILQRARSGFSSAEVQGGIDYLTRATPGRWATADVVADEIAALAIEGLPLDFPSRALERMRSLASGDLEAAMSRLGAGGWSVVVVADAEAVAPALEGLGVAPVEIVAP